MCIIYDNLRKRLGSVSKDRCIFVFLTVLSIVAGIYCCDIPALSGFEWLIHHSEFLKNISYSVVAAYIFYLVQYVIPNYILGKKALKLLTPKLKKVCNLLEESKILVDKILIQHEYKEELSPNGTVKSGEFDILVYKSINGKKYERTFERQKLFDLYREEIENHLNQLKKHHMFHYLKEDIQLFIGEIESSELLDLAYGKMNIYDDEKGIAITDDEIKRKIKIQNENSQKLQKILKLQLNIEIEIKKSENVRKIVLSRSQRGEWTPDLEK